MKIWQNSTWIGCLTLLIVHQISQKLLHWSIPFLDSYLDPFLGMPVLLGTVLQERRWFFNKYVSSKKDNVYQFSLLEIVVISILLSLILEEGFSAWSANFTHDYWDYLAYYLGSMIFYFLINRQQ